MDLRPRNIETDECEHNYLEIRDGDDKDAPLRGRYCHNRAPPPITSYGSALFVHLVSEYGYSGRLVATYSVLHSCKYT